jgi:hypothetical protein
VGEKGARQRIRDGALNKLLQVADAKEELERVVEVFPAWCDSGRELEERHTLDFLGTSRPLLPIPLPVINVSGTNYTQIVAPN